MGNASRYWNYSKKKTSVAMAEVPPLRNSPEPLHVVTHRNIGDIPGCTMLPENERYIGVFPSKQACDFINEIKEEKMKFFDDGRRMQYGKPDSFVTVKRCDVLHPIKYPPEGFKLVDDQWEYHGEKP